MAYRRTTRARTAARPARTRSSSSRARTTRKPARKASTGRSRSPAQTIKLVIEAAPANPVARPIAASEPDGPKRGKF